MAPPVRRVLGRLALTTNGIISPRRQSEVYQGTVRRACRCGWLRHYGRGIRTRTSTRVEWEAYLFYIYQTWCPLLIPPALHLKLFELHSSSRLGPSSRVVRRTDERAPKEKPGPDEHWVDRIDHDFLFGDARLPLLAPGTTVWRNDRTCVDTDTPQS